METLASLRRQWILTCVLILLTLGGTAFALVKLPWTYQSEASLVFLVPRNVAKTFQGNPYLAFSSTLNETADVVRYEVSSLQTSNKLANRGYTGTYLITDAVDTTGPVLDVTVTGTNKQEVEHTLYGVTGEINNRLKILQSGLGPDNRIRDLTITFTPQPTRLASKKARPLAMLFGVGVVLTLGIPVVVDAIVLRRRARRNAGQGRAEPSDQMYDWYPDELANGNPAVPGRPRTDHHAASQGDGRGSTAAPGEERPGNQEQPAQHRDRYRPEWTAGRAARRS